MPPTPLPMPSADTAWAAVFVACAAIAGWAIQQIRSSWIYQQKLTDHINECDKRQQALESTLNKIDKKIDALAMRRGWGWFR